MIYEGWSSMGPLMRFEGEFTSEEKAIEFAKDYYENHKCKYMKIKILGKEDVIYIG